MEEEQVDWGGKSFFIEHEHTFSSDVYEQ